MTNTALEPPQSDNVLVGTVRMSSYLGFTSRHFVAVGGAEVMVDQAPDSPIVPGTVVYLEVPRYRSRIFAADAGA